MDDQNQTADIAQRISHRLPVHGWVVPVRSDGVEIPPRIQVDLPKVFAGGVPVTFIFDSGGPADGINLYDAQEGGNMLAFSRGEHRIVSGETVVFAVVIQ